MIHRSHGQVPGKKPKKMVKTLPRGGKAAPKARNAAGAIRVVRAPVARGGR